MRGGAPLFELSDGPWSQRWSRRSTRTAGLLAAPAEGAEEGEAARAADGEGQRAHPGLLRERGEGAAPQRLGLGRHALDLRADGRGARLAFRLHEEVREALEGEVARALRDAA